MEIRMPDALVLGRMNPPQRIEDSALPEETAPAKLPLRADTAHHRERTRDLLPRDFVEALQLRRRRGI